MTRFLLKNTMFAALFATATSLYVASCAPPPDDDDEEEGENNEGATEGEGEDARPLDATCVPSARRWSGSTRSRCAPRSARRRTSAACSATTAPHSSTLPASCGG